ncbi:MAG: serine/threonine protein kinase [Deltaproteobacteria bacterium]|nr:serine/threonine protein kinase [Deltaproteobacteria bacterium]
MTAMRAISEVEPLAEDTLQPGQVLGRYRIVRRIAVGGMAELYLAYAIGVEGFQRLVAIKRALPRLARDPAFAAMFLDEARLVATLAHPNIAQVYDVGVDGHSLYLVMEYLDGRDLRRVLHTAVQRGERVPIAIAAGIAAQVAAGLHAAHENRAPDRTPLHIVHRDVSPANVVATFGGAIKLIDFGIAKAARRTTVSVAGQLKGKAAYMSPEQCIGGPIDRRSDVFALGVLLYELSTTRRLFRGADEYATMKQIVEGEIEAPSRLVEDYPVELEDIVLRALARDPSDRYHTARDVHLDLVRFAQSHGLAVTEYDLARYLRRLMPDEVERSLLDRQATLETADGSAPVAKLRPASLAPLAASPRAFERASSAGPTLVPDGDPETRIYERAARPRSMSELVIETTPPPPAPRRIAWPYFALAFALMFLSGWLAATYAGG